MAPHAHRNEARSRSARVWIATVSSTRTLETDRGGPVLIASLESQGHEIAGREILPDDPERVRGRILSLAGASDIDALVLTGGTGISAQDGTFEAVTGTLDKTLPGFGELFRMLSWEQVGSAAILSRAVAGVARGLVVFSVPGSPKACQLAADRLIGPELGHLVFELGKEAPAAPARRVEATASEEPEADAEVVEEEPRKEGGFHVSEHGPKAVKKRKPEPEAPLAGWFAALDQLKGELHRGERLVLPEALTNIAASKEILESAGEQARATLPTGNYAVLGWPDLRRSEARVLLVGRDEVVALHRRPTATGLVAPKAGGILFHAGRLGRTSEEVTGRDFPGEGRLFALDGTRIWVKQGDRVVSWDGRRETDEGTLSQATSSLLLGWSQR